MAKSAMLKLCDVASVTMELPFIVPVEHLKIMSKFFFDSSWTMECMEVDQAYPSTGSILCRDHEIGILKDLLVSLFDSYFWCAKLVILEE